MKVKVFISQPMANKSNEEIESERKEIKELLDQNSFFKDAPHNARPLWFLGKSFELLSTADVCVFAKGWENARGCIMEHLACENYKITIWEL